jgi:MFS family permease
MADTTGIIEEPELTPWRGPTGLRALRNRDYALFWSGLAVSATGSWMQNLAQGWLVYQMTHSQLYLGLVAAASQLPVMLLALPGGVVADRLSKRRIVITTQSAAMILAVALSALALYGVIRPWHVIVFAILNGCVNAMDVPARQAMAMELVGREDLFSAVALNSSAFNGARIIGPAIAGVIVEHFGGQGVGHSLASHVHVAGGAAARGAGACFFVNGVSFAAVVVALLLVRSTRFRTGSKSQSVLREMIEGLRYAKSNALIREILIMTAVMSVFALQYSSQMPAFASGVLGVGAKGLGGLLSATGIGALAAALSVAAVGHLLRQRSMLTFGSLVVPAGLVMLSATRSYPVALACMVVTGFGMMVFMTVSNTMVQMASPDDMRGRIISLRTWMFMGVAWIGAFQLGVVAQYYGVQSALRFGAVFCAVTAIYFALRPSKAKEAE